MSNQDLKFPSKNNKIVPRPSKDDAFAAIFTYNVSDKALEAAAGGPDAVKCSDCGGTCDSRCSTSTR